MKTRKFYAASLTGFPSTDEYPKAIKDVYVFDSESERNFWITDETIEYVKVPVIGTTLKAAKRSHPIWRCRWYNNPRWWNNLCESSGWWKYD